MLDQTATDLPLGSGSVSRQQVMKTKAIGPIVQPKNHTREGSSLEQTLRAIGTDQLDSFRSICMKSMEMLHGRDKPHNVTAGAASSMRVQDEALRNNFSNYTLSDLDAIQDQLLPLQRNYA